MNFTNREGIFMKSSIKRIVAREGLILISLLIIGGGSMVVQTKLADVGPVKFEQDKLDQVKEIRRILMNANDSFIPDAAFSYRMVASIAKDVYPEYSDISDKDLAAKIQKKYHINVSYEESTRNKRTQLSEIFLGIGIFFLFLAYPVYLLMRFCVWAVRTLRQPVTE